MRVRCKDVSRFALDPSASAPPAASRSALGSAPASTPSLLTGIETAIPVGSGKKESDMPESSNDESGRPATRLTSSDLAQFTGTEQIYRHALVRHIRYTDGVQHVAEAGEAYWLIDKIACAQLERRHVGQEFQVWTLTVRDDRSADLVCTDGNEVIVSSERITFTDFPLPEIRLYVTNHTILLPSEY